METRCVAWPPGSRPTAPGRSPRRSRRLAPWRRSPCAGEQPEALPVDGGQRCPGRTPSAAPARSSALRAQDDRPDVGFASADSIASAVKGADEIGVEEVVGLVGGSRRPRPGRLRPRSRPAAPHRAIGPAGVHGIRADGLCSKWCVVGRRRDRSDEGPADRPPPAGHGASLVNQMCRLTRRIHRRLLLVPQRLKYVVVHRSPPSGLPPGRIPAGRCCLCFSRRCRPANVGVDDATGSSFGGRFRRRWSAKITGIDVGDQCGGIHVRRRAMSTRAFKLGRISGFEPRNIGRGGSWPGEPGRAVDHPNSQRPHSRPRPAQV